MKRILNFTILTGTYLFVHNCVMSKKKLNDKLLQKQQLIQTMKDSFKKQKDHRNTIDLKLHDKLGANLSALNLQINLIKKHLPEHQYKTINNLLHDSIIETRKISNKIDTPYYFQNKQ